MDPEPDHVQVLAVQLHVVDCPSKSLPYANSSQRHRKAHVSCSSRVLTGLRNAGYTLTSLEEDR